MRQLFEQYHAHIGKKLENPFAGLGFSLKGKRGRRRPAFSVEWLTAHFTNTQTQLRHLNRQARAIIFIILETGGRPSEICNLDRNTIRLDAPVPHIIIEPRDDPDDPREIKTESSIRIVPLVGVALVAAKAFPDGFPRYRNKERTLSNTLTKSLRTHGLLETPKHKAYSLRHAYEDRMKAGMIDPEIRRFLMGHSLDRPEYGSTANLLKHVRGELERIALPFDPSIV
jgi:integrase